MSVAAEGHIPQIFYERFVCSDSKLVEDCAEFVIRSAIQVHADRVSRFWCLRGMHPVCGGKRDCLMLQVSIRNFVVLFRWHMVLHGRGVDLCDGQLTAEAGPIASAQF